MSNSNITLAAIEQAIGLLSDPETGRSLSKSDQIRNIAWTDDSLTAEIALGTHSLPIADEFQQRAVETIQAKFPNFKKIDITISTIDRPPPTIGQVGLRVRSVIAVGSGKGGVGKSTIAASIALTLKRMGARVGLMDADIYGPSIPHLLNLEGRPEVIDGKIQPRMFGSMPVMSMGFLVEKDQAVIFRGPMLHGSITQFLRDTNWGPLDYLIIDMPPGTGDIALTLSQLLPLTGAVVVCTPQEVALLDAVKAISMFQKTKIPLLGVVENMSGFICPDNGKRYDIFGHGGARRKAEELSVPFLGEVPINIAMRQESDEGRLDQVLQDPICGVPIEKIVRSLVRDLAQRNMVAPPKVSLPVLG